MAVLRPLKVTITNLPDSLTHVEMPDFPADEARGSHTVPLERTIYIERDDFQEVRPASFFPEGWTRRVIGRRGIRTNKNVRKSLCVA